MPILMIIIILLRWPEDKLTRDVRKLENSKEFEILQKCSKRVVGINLRKTKFFENSLSPYGTI